MATARPVRISRAGRLGRAQFEVSGTVVTVMSAAGGSIAAAALAVRDSLTPMDLASGAARPRAVDRVAAVAAGVAGCGVLVMAGRDVGTAGAPPQGGWRLRLDPDRTLLVLPSGGMATVRPAPPGSSWRSVTVVAESCRRARTAALSAASRPDASSWLAAQGLAGRLVGADGWVSLAGAWPSEPAAA